MNEELKIGDIRKFHMSYEEIGVVVEYQGIFYIIVNTEGELKRIPKQVKNSIVKLPSEVRETLTNIGEHYKKIKQFRDDRRNLDNEFQEQKKEYLRKVSEIESKIQREEKEVKIMKNVAPQKANIINEEAFMEIFLNNLNNKVKESLDIPNKYSVYIDYNKDVRNLYLCIRRKNRIKKKVQAGDFDFVNKRLNSFDEDELFVDNSQYTFEYTQLLNQNERGNIKLRNIENKNLKFRVFSNFELLYGTLYYIHSYMIDIGNVKLTDELAKKLAKKIKLDDNIDSNPFKWNEIIQKLNNT